MSTMKTLSEFCSKLGETAKGLCKIAVQSRAVTKGSPRRPDSRIIILANGPSLRGTVDNRSDLLRESDTLAVNFFANTPEFNLIRPKYYVLADPHFFKRLDQTNVVTLWENLRQASWPIRIFVPARYRRDAERHLQGVRQVETFNFVGVEGFGWFERLAYRSGLAMPRPRNVLIPAIMTAIRVGYGQIVLTGADHSWLETIRVNERNEVVSIQPHFYQDSKTEVNRSVSEYRGYRLHDILQSFYTAFRSYHRVAEYASAVGVRIENATPGSYIDAFPRTEL